MLRVLKKWRNTLLEKILISSLIESSKQNGYRSLIDKLKKAVCDIGDQYTTFRIDSEFLNIKVRCQHSFQMEMIEKACKNIKKENICVVDIGDSSGTHLRYLQNQVICVNKTFDALSVNLDPMAIEKIESKGLRGVCCRAEELHLHPEFLEKDKVDMFLCFEMMEHLFNPIAFLYSMAKKSNGEYFVITVPYLATSRVGLHAIRNGRPDKMFAENTHIFELSPPDWKLLFTFAGWSVVEEKIYLQYPKFHPLYIMKWIWKRIDFEGFYGVVLKKDLSFANRYQSW